MSKSVRLDQIEKDMQETTKLLEERTNDRSPSDAWTDDYMEDVMSNQKWLISQVRLLQKVAHEVHNSDGNTGVYNIIQIVESMD